MKKTIKRARKHYILLNKQANTVLIYYHKQSLADDIGVNVSTISRHLAHSDVYDMKEYYIWANVLLRKRSKG